MFCRECINNGNCAYNIMLPYINGSSNIGTDNPNGKIVNIDKCLLPEILRLWEDGIKTTGCCCGHGLLQPYIGVKEEYFDKMIYLGYEHIDTPEQFDQNSFMPKTKLQYGIANKGFNWWDK